MGLKEGVQCELYNDDHDALGLYSAFQDLVLFLGAPGPQSLPEYHSP